MCGRFTLFAKPDDLKERYNLEEIPFELKPRYNIAPST
ncbi:MULTISPECIES: SOS response-associated peptidase family protein [Brevibacillus]